MRALLQRQEHPEDQINPHLHEPTVHATYYISDLQSSRAEVEEMRHQLSTLSQEKEAFNAELSRQAENHQRELALQKAEQHLELQRRADQQKRGEFDRQ
jgi:hypothetical protein